MIGHTISHYLIQAKLGEGGMGVVYKAQDTKLERTVALKFVAPNLVSDTTQRKRFQREAMAAAALDHPNICTVFEIDEAEGTLFLVMPFVDGSTVKDFIAERPMKVRDALDIAIQAAQGSADGKRFVILDRINERSLLIHVVNNWFEEFRGR